MDIEASIATLRPKSVWPKYQNPISEALGGRAEGRPPDLDLDLLHAVRERSGGIDAP